MEWFLRRGNNRRFGWKRITQSVHLIPKWPLLGKNWRELHENEVIRARLGGIRIRKLTSWHYKIIAIFLCFQNLFSSPHAEDAKQYENDTWPLWPNFRSTRASFFPRGGHFGMRCIACFRWKIKWRLERLGALGTIGETAPLMRYHTRQPYSFCAKCSGSFRFPDLRFRPPPPPPQVISTMMTRQPAFK